MTESLQFAGSRASPALRYRDVAAATDWLCAAFGFEVHSVETDDHGVVRYAELAFKNTVIMLGPVSSSEIDRLMRQPDDIGGAETQCCYYVVEDIDAHYVRARSAGCKIAIDLKTLANGGRIYTGRDPEGHLWSFGTYDPWGAATAKDPMAAITSAAPETIDTFHPFAADAPHLSAISVRRLAAGISVAAVGAVCAAIWIYGESWQTSREAAAAPAGPELMIGNRFTNEMSRGVLEDVRRRLVLERSLRRSAERALQAARQETEHERSLRMAAEKAAEELSKKLTFAQRAKDLAEAARSDAVDRATADARADTEKAKRDAEAARAELAKLQKAQGRATADARADTEKAKRDAEAARAELAELQKAKEAAEREAREARVRLTFVSQKSDAPKGTLNDIRKQLADEQAAREAAEREVEEANAKLANERSSRQAAWRTVEQLKRRLAQAGIKPVQAVPKPVAATKPKPVSQTTSTTASSDKAAEWNMYRGPAFYKQ